MVQRARSLSLTSPILEQFKTAVFLYVVLRQFLKVYRHLRLCVQSGEDLRPFLALAIPRRICAAVAAFARDFVAVCCGEG